MVKLSTMDIENVVKTARLGVCYSWRQ